jgi:hypothetical protein
VIEVGYACWERTCTPARTAYRARVCYRTNALQNLLSIELMLAAENG